MKPLSQWLTERDAPPPPAIIAEDFAPEALLPFEPVEEPPPPPDPSEELRARLAEAEETIATLRAEHARAGEELRQQLGEALAERIGAEIARGFDGLLSQLEGALTQVLTPFLSQAARDRAVTELKALLQRELASAAEPVVELRAPAELHEMLSTLNVKLIEAEAVEIVFAGERQRFEELSARWCAMIEEREP